MIIGFTGSQRGMTEKQKRAVTTILSRLAATTIHHGDCVGADFEFDSVARTLNFNIVVHPPINPKKRAYVANDDNTTHLTPKPYKDRNRDIVDACNLLVAAPKGPECLRSGTWSTVRYARKKHKTIVIVEP